MDVSADGAPPALPVRFHHAKHRRHCHLCVTRETVRPAVSRLVAVLRTLGIVLRTLDSRDTPLTAPRETRYFFQIS